MNAPFDYDRSRAMKQTELVPCARCRKGMLHAGLPLFYRVTVELMGIDMQAVSRQHGLEQVLGGGAAAAGIAFAMGPQEDMGLPIGSAQRGLICQPCAHDLQFEFAALLDVLGRETPAAGETEEGERS